MEYLPLNSFKKNHQPLCLRPKFSTFLMYPAEARIPAYSKSFKLWIQQNFLSTSIDFQNSSAMSSQTKITLYLLLKLSFFNIIRFISGKRFKNIKLDSSSLDIFHKHKVLRVSSKQFLRPASVIVSDYCFVAIVGAANGSYFITIQSKIVAAITKALQIFVVGAATWFQWSAVW